MGDTRVRWAVSAASEASVLAAVGAGGVMVPWRSGVRAKVAGLKQTLNELREGAVPLDEFFDALHAEAAGQVWALRLLSLFLFWLGLVLFTRPIAIAPDFVSCIGRLGTFSEPSRNLLGARPRPVHRTRHRRARSASVSLAALARSS